MERVLYYVIEKEFANVGFVEECTGYKDITVYEIQNNIPIKFFNVEGRIDQSSKTLINDWLNENGYGDETFKLFEL
jgi:hypothetical protein